MAMGGGKGLIIALGAEKPKGEGEAESKGEGGAMSAARALLKAIKAGDAAGVDEALRIHRDCCEMDGEYEDD